MHRKPCEIPGTEISAGNAHRALAHCKLASWPNLPLRILNFDASKHPLVFATESYPKENGHANCPRDPIMNLIESRRNRGDGRKILLGRIIDVVAPIRRHFLSLLLEGLGLPD